MEKKIAVVFPGVGYHADKPLLYYSRKIAGQYGYEVQNVPYQGFPPGIRGKSEKMKDTLELALLQCEEFLKEKNLREYGSVLFLSKSIGTAVASAYAGRHQLTTKNVFFTPVEETFPLMRQDGIIFHGTRDPWLEERAFFSGCAGISCPYYLVEGANHSLETGDTQKDLENLRWIMGIVEEYIRTSLSET